jgi:hypothetical protein
MTGKKTDKKDYGAIATARVPRTVAFKIARDIINSQFFEEFTFMIEEGWSKVQYKYGVLNFSTQYGAIAINEFAEIKKARPHLINALDDAQRSPHFESLNFNMDVPGEYIEKFKISDKDISDYNGDSIWMSIESLSRDCKFYIGNSNVTKEAYKNTGIGEAHRFIAPIVGKIVTSAVYEREQKRQKLDDKL